MAANPNINAEKIQGNLSITSVSATTYYNLPSIIGLYLPLSGGTVTGNTIFQSGLTASTISTTNKLSVGGPSQNLSAIIEITSTTQGVLFPRMTNTQRESIVSPVPGLFVYCTDSPEGLFMYKSTGWVQIM